MALAARLEAPRVAAWASLAATVDGDPSLPLWPVACGKLHASLAAAVQAINDEDPSCVITGHSEAPLDDDLNPRSASTSSVVVYLDPHAPTLAAALDDLMAVTAVHVMVRYRPAISEMRVPLVGFGASLRVKSSEYRVVDEDASRADLADDDEDAPDLGADDAPSWLLRTKGSEAIDSKDGALPAERLRELGTRAAVAVLRSRRPLATLRDVGGALPSLARPLSRLNLTAAIAIVDALKQQQPYLSSVRGALTVNGLPLSFSAQDASLHELLRAVLHEGSAAAALCARGVSPRRVSRLMRLPPPSPLRIDVRGLKAMWLQDVAADTPFKDWSSDLSLVTKAVFPPGASRFLKRNLYTAVFAFDPATIGGALLGGYAALLCKKAAPLRVGALPIGAHNSPDAPAEVGPRLLGYAQAVGGRTAVIAMLKSLATAAAASLAKGGSESGSATAQLLPKAALREALAAALAAANEDSAGKKKKKAKKAKASTVAGAADGDAHTDAASILLDEMLKGSGSAEPNATAVEQMHEYATIAAGLGLPSGEPTVLLNGLVLRGSDFEALKKALAEQLRLEARRVLDGTMLPPTSPDGATEGSGALLDAILTHMSASLTPAFSTEAEQQARRDYVAVALAGAAGEGAAAGGDTDVEGVMHVLEDRVWAPAKSSPRRVTLVPKLGECASSSTCIELPGEGAGSALHFVAVVEPLSRSAHKIASLLIALRSALGVRCTVLLAAQAPEHAAQLPLTAFHSLALHLDPTRITPPAANFEVRSAQQVLTLTPEAPAGWSLDVHSSTEDLDNIQIASGQPVQATFSLSRLVLHGACTEGTKGGSKGAKGKGGKGQAKGNRGNAVLCDSATMRLAPAAEANSRAWPGTTVYDEGVASLTSETLVLGSPPMPVEGERYFQLSVPGPGLWALSLADSGSRSGGAALIGASGKPTTQVHVPLVTYAGGKVAVRVVDDSKARQTDASTATADPEDTETVHCFSLASGLLYERFLRIMMASAAERSSKPLKFWLLGNFLSAGFRQSVRSGALAKAVGAQVAIVTYSWPAHLRFQSEKQRLIWGYKILFLDVLFPQHVTKIMYIDADQIVQGDLAQLWALDLGGKAVAMTPFCQQHPNNLTTGFRFWSDGFWKNHLMGQAYHISALFVVDLTRFRAGGIGNVYRDTYQSLTADPNSLSNLDQDLPNYLQHMVPMHSLPEEWLWCESWCSNTSKARAKTIDLCNNPLTKEAKLDQAKRIGGERWLALDARTNVESEEAEGPDAAARRGIAKEEL